MSDRALANVTPRGATITALPANPMAEWDLIRTQAEVLVKSGLLPPTVKTPEAAVAIMVLGRELGFKPMQSFRLIDVILGKPTVNAAGMAGMVQSYCRQNGGYLRAIETTADRATIEFKRPEWPTPHTLTFSVEDAKRANLTTKDTWKAYPGAMCYARAIAAAARMGWPEVVGGIYDPEELGGGAQPQSFSEPIDPVVGSGARTIVEVIEAEPSPTGNPLARLHAVGAERFLDHDGIHRVMRFLLPGFDSLAKLGIDQLDYLIREIETGSDEDLAAWTTDWAAEIDNAPDLAILTDVGAEMARVGITRESHKHLFAAFNQRKIALRKPAPAATEQPTEEQHPFGGMPDVDRYAS